MTAREAHGTRRKNVKWQDAFPRRRDHRRGGGRNALRNQYFAEDIRWHLPGRGPPSGDYEGVTQVLESFSRLFELTGGTYRVELHDVLGTDEHAVALYASLAQRAGRQLEDSTVLTAHIHDGKLTEVWVRPTDLYVWDGVLS